MGSSFNRLRGCNHDGGIFSIAFSPVGDRLVTAGGDHKIIAWDVATGEKLYILEGPGDGMNQKIAYSPDGKWIAASMNATVQLWHAEDGTPAQSIAGRFGLRPTES